MANILVDTNVLVYAYDRSEFAKQAIAEQVLNSLHSAGTGFLSVQCLAEFFRVTTKGTEPMLTVEQARQQTAELARSWQVLDLTPLVVLEAVRGVNDHQFAYWDAQIWATARLNQIPWILSEDFTDGAVVEGVRFQNPFLPAFDLNTVLA